MESFQAETLKGLRQELKKHGLRHTVVREQVLRVFYTHQAAISQGELEDQIGPVDRITLYRTLRTFEEKGLIHRAVDGTDKLKFALCHSGCSPEEHHDRHAHIHCDKCGRTMCLENLPVPGLVAVPGFEVTTSYWVLQGICAQCKDN